MKKLLALVLALAMTVSLVACSNNDPGTSSAGSQESAPVSDDDSGTPGYTDEVISLTLWGAEEDQELLSELVDRFKETYGSYVKDFDIQIGVESESTAKDTILTDVEAAADVYAFASDQLPDLVAAGAVLALDGEYAGVLPTYADKTVDDVKAANSAGSVDAATYNGSLYAFPFAADGYFMFYDPSCITAEQAASWDTLLDAANAAGKKVAMTLASGWYNASFFYGAGFVTELNEDGTTYIDWNGTSADGYTGVQVVEAMLNIAGNSAFQAVEDGGLSNAIASGNVCAVISGCWDSKAARENWGEDYVACKLPTYTLDGEQIQTGSVASYKLMGVNPYAENIGWAVLLAEFLTNEQSQVTRFEQRDLAPSNIAAASDPAVAANKGVAGLAEQSAYAKVQVVGGKYWDPTATFGEMIAQGTLTVGDTAGIQAALDSLVEGVTAAVG